MTALLEFQSYSVPKLSKRDIKGHLAANAAEDQEQYMLSGGVPFTRKKFQLLHSPELHVNHVGL
jgi:hypothetical protein